MKNIIAIIAILVIPVLIYLSVANSPNRPSAANAKSDNIPTVMTFTSTMCMDCQKMKAVLKEIEPEYEGKVNFLSINATAKDKTVKDLVKKHNITLVPTMVFFDINDNELKRIEGAISKDDLKSELDSISNG